MRFRDRDVHTIMHHINYQLKGFQLAFSMLGSSSQRKHFMNWLHSHQKGYLLKRPMPWIVYDAYDYLVKALPANIRVFEYGSGGSTLFWLTHKESECISIEHNPQWFAIVQNYASGLKDDPRLDYRLVEPTQSNSDKLNPFDPANYLDNKIPNVSFENYVKQIDGFPDAYFDVVLIDGEARPSCILHSWEKVKRGGIMIVDNADRTEYFKHIGHILEPFDELSFRGVVPAAMIMSQTNVYLRR